MRIIMIGLGEGFDYISSIIGIESITVGELGGFFRFYFSDYPTD